MPIFANRLWFIYAVDLPKVNICSLVSAKKFEPRLPYSHPTRCTLRPWTHSGYAIVEEIFVLEKIELTLFAQNAQKNLRYL